MKLLEVHNLSVVAENKQILHDVSFSLNAGETVVLMGPNGSGKSTLAHVLMGHPGYEVTNGTALIGGEDLFSLKPEERAKAGLFLSFQYPQTIAGVTVGNFLRLSYNSTHDQKLTASECVTLLKRHMDELSIPHDWITRSVNEGFSGGEKKKLEMLQLALLQPKLAILDETDSGLDVDALRIIASRLSLLRQQYPEMSFFIVTHYRHLLKFMTVDRVFILKDGQLVHEGQSALIDSIEETGYQALPTAGA